MAGRCWLMSRHTYKKQNTPNKHVDSYLRCYSEASKRLPVHYIDLFTILLDIDMPRREITELSKLKKKKKIAKKLECDLITSEL